MNFKEEMPKFSISLLIRYAPLFIGVGLFLFGQFITTWKKSSDRAASSNVEAVQLEVTLLEKKIEDSDDADDKKEYREQIKDLKEDTLEELQIKALKERIDAKQGIWFLSMVTTLGACIMCFSFVLIATLGSAHEKIGSLIALAFLMSMIR